MGLLTLLERAYVLFTDSTQIVCDIEPLLEAIALYAPPDFISKEFDIEYEGGTGRIVEMEAKPLDADKVILRAAWALQVTCF